jgi:hypothetical protein
MWVMLGCILIGTALFFIGQFIQKGTHLAEVFSGQEKSSPWGDRLFWIGAVLFGVGLAFLVWVFPIL